MTRKFSRNHSLRVGVPFFAILALFIAAAVLAQTLGTDRPSGKANALLAPAGTSAPAQAERPLTPWTGAGSSPVGRSHTKRNGARPLDGNPLFVPAVSYGSGGSNPYSIAVADVNLDRKPDLVVANYCGVGCVGDGSVSVLLGNGDGTFQPAVTYDSGGAETYSVAVADVNGDGKPDVVVANFGSNTVGVLLGNGDGTFQPAVTYPSGAAGSGATCPDAVTIADVNGDRKPDVIVANYCAENYLTKLVGVLLGNGDGTFQPAAAYGSGGLQPYSVAAADVNADGKPDLLVANWVASNQNTGQGTVGVLLGNGDGTFQPAVAYSSGGTLPYSIAVADVNGDGKPDIAVANCAPTDSYACPNWGGSGGKGVIGILLGTGDGAFQPVVTYDSGGLYATSIAIADVNADGKPDLLVANWCAGGGCGAGDAVVGVLLGSGDGTFQPAVTYDSGGGAAWSVAVADVNDDGMPDLLVVNSFSNSVSVLLHSNPTTTTLVSSLNPSGYGQSVTFTAAVSASSGTPTGIVIFNDGSTQLGSGTLANGSASLSTTSLGIGSHSITAAYQGCGGFDPSTSAPLNQILNPASTSTSLSSSEPRARKGDTVTYTATVSSQYGGAVTGTVTFQDETGSATVQLASNHAYYSKTYAHVGYYHVTATYSGDANNLGSTSPVLTEDYGKPRMGTWLVFSTSANPSPVGQPVTFTASVGGEDGPPPDGEVVDFCINKCDNRLLAQVPMVNSTAVFTTSSLPAGKYYMLAVYPGDEVFLEAKHDLVQVIAKYQTTTTLTSSLNPSQYGQTVTFTSQVTSTGPLPTGTVQFYRDGRKLGTGAVNNEGVATFATSVLKVDTWAITAEYKGDTYNATSTSPTVDQVVQ